MSDLSRLLRKQIQLGYWPGFIVGMYPSQFAYQPIKVDFDTIWRDVAEINLYYHIPFCKWHCSFCTFFKVLKHQQDYFVRYIDKVNQQVLFYSDRFGQRVNIKSICFGGGTPNAIDAEQYEKVFETLTRANVAFDANLEPSMEISPETITEDYIRTVAAAGVKRLSLGVQSLKSDLRKSVNRARPLNIYEIIDAIRKYNLNVNIDLINGLKGQDDESFMDTLQEVVKIGPETISIYLLSGQSSSLFKNDPTLMTTREKYELFDLYYAYLLEHGYRYESHVKFVKLDTRSTHQQKIYEYQGVSTLGIGCGARSYNPLVHYSTPWLNERIAANKLIDDYIEKDFEHLPWTGFFMDEDETKRRFIIYSFFVGELDTTIYQRRFGASVLQDFQPQMTALVDNALVDIQSDGKIMLTPKGRKYTDLTGTLFWSEPIREMFNSHRQMELV